MFLQKEKGIFYIMLTMALINFFSRLTYENILSPMILARSDNNSIVLGIVNACMVGVGGIAASIPIPFIMANQNAILYKKVPQKMQGRVFAVRNAIQYSTIPVGILLGGVLADYVFEPYMRSETGLTEFLRKIVGSGTGSGMAVMFLCTGICGFVVSMVSCFLPEIRKLNH